MIFSLSDEDVKRKNNKNKVWEDQYQKVRL